MERIGDWIQTFSGRQFWPLDPRVAELCIEDIAHALAHQCRFGGHVNRFYSVAEHSVRLSEIVPEDDRLWGLLHDASEAYLCDIPSPIKRNSMMGGIYRQHEEVLMRVIADRFRLALPEPQSVKYADGVMLLTEQRDLMKAQVKPWRALGPPLEAKIEPWTPIEAEIRFLDRFEQLAAE